MRQQLLSISLIAVLAITLSACHSMPEHAKFIPKDAVAVVSVNVSAMGKKMVWSAITGSKIFDEWKAHPSEKDAMKGIDNAGIDYMNTLYLYTKKDERFSGGMRITGLIPLDDASKFETFLKKNFPQLTVKEQGKRKEAMINENLYAGWDSKLLVIINAKANNASPVHFSNEGDSTNISIQPAAGIDAAVLSAEMDKAFAVTKDNALTGNKHFMALQKEGHDISLWVNNENMMSDYMANGAGGMTGLSLSNSLWKDAAFTVGFDFNKGNIKSDMKYYMPADLKEIAHDLGSNNVDKEMVEKLPTGNLDMIGSWHLSPKALKAIMEKTGVLGLANIAMAAQNLSVDEVLGAFTGDMGFAMNDLAVTQPTASQPADSTQMRQDYKTSVNYVYVIKIDKKENFNKLVQLAVTSQVMQSAGNNTYTMPMAGPQSPVLMVSDKYAVVSNKAENATAYLNGSNKGPKLADLAATSVVGHPLGMFFDVQQMVKSLDPAIKNGEMDAATIAEAKKLVENMAMNGGEFRNDAFEWNMAVNFTNKDENSLIQILNFAMHMSDAQNKGTTAYNTKNR